jgi:microcystin-dependent protein
MAEQYLGEIRMFGFNFAPVGWALCNGQLMPISQNTALFSLLGTQYGGDGVTTFALPDLRSRVPIHMGEGVGLTNYIIGENGGSENVTLLAAQMPQHNHMVNCNASATGRGGSTFDAGAGQTPVNSYPGPAASPSNSVYSPAATANTTMNQQMLGLAGGNQSHPNIQPYLTVNFCIALTGIFPRRN